MQKSQSSIVYPRVKFQDVLGAFWRGIKPQSRWLYVLLFSIIMGNIIPIIIPIFYKQFFDVIVENAQRTVIAPKLFTIIMYVAILNFLYWLFYRFAEFANNTYQPNTMARLKQQN